MAGGRSLEQTPTWAVAVFCFVLVLISFFIEHIIHFISKWLKKKHERAFQDALEKIKSELMLLGFISLLLTVGGGPISNICVSKRLGSTWHPCNDEKDDELGIEDRRGLLSLAGFGGGVRRALAVSEGDSCAAEGKVALVSSEGIHQLHRFIFVLAVFHVVYCILTMALGRVKMRRWKKWEKETRTIEYQISQDPQRFRLTRDTSFGRRHLGFWTKPPLLHIVCFFRQFVRSVPKVDYLTLRHGFIMAHLAPGSQMEFDFQKYIKRSLEEDFKVVVGISPPIWLFAIIFLLFNTHGWYSYLWLPFIPLIIILIVGTKLQVIITKMGVQIQAREGVVKGALVVQPDDHLFWFNRPCLLLYLINFVLFQNAFHLAFFVWTWYEFGIRSCFNEHTADMVIQITTGILGQILCSYVTLPLYAVVTQMGSNMKPAVFNEKVAAALRKWHQKARKNIKRRKGGGSVSSAVTPLSSTPTAPSHHLISPGHLLNQLQRSTAESLQTSPTGFDCGDQESESPSPPSRRYSDASTSYLTCRDSERADCSSENSVRLEHAIDIEKEFSFGRRIEE